MARIVPDTAALIPEQATRVFKGEIFDVYQWPQQLFDGSTATFERLKRPDTVIVICIKDDKLIFIREEQPGRPELLRLPGGRVDEGEDWDVAVQRECAEELGLQFAQWRLVSVTQPVAKIEWFVALYIATDCTHKGEPRLDPGEKITPVEMTFDEARAYFLATTDPLNAYTRQFFEGIHSLAELRAVKAFQGRTIS